MGGGGGKQARSTGALPWWVQGAHQSLTDKAQDFAYGDRGAYQAYGGDRIAGLTGAENQANVARGEMFNRGDVAGQFAADQYSAASGLTDQVRDVAFSEFNQDEYNRRRNPYIDNVVEANLREADESWDRRINQSDAASIARGGSIGSYRMNLENLMAEGERAGQLTDIRNRGELDAYNQALNSFESDRSTKLAGLGQGAASYGQIGAGASQLGTESLAREQSMTNELDRSGAIQREMEQRELDMAAGDFYEERDWPMRNMNWLSGILSGVPNAQLGSVTQSSPQPGLAAQLTGLGLGAAAINQLIQ
jgi:hypothetical protein